jgi:hypothetical protein
MKVPPAFMPLMPVLPGHCAPRSTSEPPTTASGLLTPLWSWHAENTTSPSSVPTIRPSRFTIRVATTS